MINMDLSFESIKLKQNKKTNSCEYSVTTQF